MEDLNHRPNASTLILEDVIVPVLPFLPPPGDIWNLFAKHLAGSKNPFIMGVLTCYF
jgi:hypothetical protein